MTQSSENDRNDKKWMQKAADLALKNIDVGGGPFGAIIVRDGEIIGQGANRVTEQPRSTAHAEIMAIRDACQTAESFSLEGATLCSSHCVNLVQIVPSPPPTGRDWNALSLVVLKTTPLPLALTMLFSTERCVYPTKSARSLSKDLAATT